MSPRSIFFASSTSCAAVSSWCRPASRRKSCSASVVDSTVGAGGGGGGGAFSDFLRVVDDLDAARLELAVEQVELEDVELVRFRQVVDVGLPDRAGNLAGFQQDLDVLVLQDGFDFYGHSLVLGVFPGGRLSKHVLASRARAAVVFGIAGRGGFTALDHVTLDNGGYVNLRQNESSAGPPQPRWTRFLPLLPSVRSGVEASEGPLAPVSGDISELTLEAPPGLWTEGPGFSTGCTNRCGNVDKRKVRKMRGVRFGLACTPPSHPLVCRLRRVRDVTRSKPRPEAVGGSRKSAGEVDESETGSANETAPFGRLFHFRAKCCALWPG